MSNTSNFFDKKKEWSKVKDELLSCYFTPYVAKILHTKKPLLYVDCFAGKGKFNDGNVGSPIIALDILKGAINNSKIQNPVVHTVFIEKKFANELEMNLKSYSNAQVIHGKYAEQINGILQGKKQFNAFLYIDPFGISGIPFSLFDGFSKMQLNTIEILLNFNSFGFIRNACKAMNTSFDLEDEFSDFLYFDADEYDYSDKSIQRLNNIAGGDYWQEIIKSKKTGKIDGYEAERLFAEKYCSKLKESYKYVLNMPIRIKRVHRPKYRMIHVTNHPDGCLLMAENIQNRWEYMKNIQNKGQLSFLTENCENEIISSDELETKVSSHFSLYDKPCHLHIALAEFYTKYGPICKKSDITDVLRTYENKGIITIKRIPEFTKSGKKSTFMSENNAQSVTILWN